jgi:hypothetical protein
VVSAAVKGASSITCTLQLGAAFVDGACGGQHQQRQPGRVAAQRRQPLLRGGVGPLPVVQEQQQRLARGQGLEQRGQRVQRRIGGGRAFGLGRRQAQQRAQRRGQPRVADIGQQPAQRRLHRRRRCIGCQRQRTAQHLHQRLQRRGGAFVGPMALQDAAALPGRALQEFARQPRLAHARRRGDRQPPRGAGQHLAERLVQLPQLTLAADEGLQRAPRARLEGADGAAAAQHRPRHHRGAAAVDGHRAPRPGLEMVQVGAQAFLADQDLVALGGVGQAAGDVGRHAQQLQAADDGVAALHQHQPGVDAAVQAQIGVAATRAEAAQRRHLAVQLHRAFHRAAAVAFARLRPAEDGQHAVALDAHQRATMRRHRGRIELAQRAQQLGVVLCLHLAAEGGGAAEIGEEDADAAPPAVARRGLGRRCRVGGGVARRLHDARTVAERGDAPGQALAVCPLQFTPSAWNKASAAMPLSRMLWLGVDGTAFLKP